MTRDIGKKRSFGESDMETSESYANSFSIWDMKEYDSRLTKHFETLRKRT